MSNLIKQDKNLVTPGEAIAEGLDYLPGNGCYRNENEIKSKLLGLVKIKDRFISVIPLSGIYLPKSRDGIIGIVSDIQSTMWIIDINSPYDAIMRISEGVREFVDLSRRDMSSYYNVGDVIYAKVSSVTKSKNIALTMKDGRCKKLMGGRILKLTPSKVPRLIGKQGSMIELIKEKTSCQIIVGQNGVVWLKGEKETLAVKAIKTIENEAHRSGLTNRISELLGGINE